MSCSSPDPRLGPSKWSTQDEQRRQADIEQMAQALQTRVERLSMPVTRCKMRVSTVTTSRDSSGQVDSETVTLAAVISHDSNDENSSWSRWTPQATFTLTITNPDAMRKLSAGHEFYVDFTPAQ